MLLSFGNRLIPYIVASFAFSGIVCAFNFFNFFFHDLFASGFLAAILF